MAFGVMSLPLHGFRVGPMRLTPYGACAAAGVVGAMALAGRTARRVGVVSEAAWDAGLFAVLSCFVASRLLLVLSDPVAFVHYPVLVMSLPSLTIAGIAVAAVAVLLYLRRKRLPVLPLLDAFAPCGALLAASLELGHWLDGSEPGMPVFQGAGGVVSGYRPSAAYGVICSLVLAGVLWVLLDRGQRPGRIAATGLMAGGLIAFLLDMLSLPFDLFGGLWLEPGQIVALGAMVAGAVLWTFAPSVAFGASEPVFGAPSAAPDAWKAAQEPSSQVRDLAHPGSVERSEAGRVQGGMD